MPEIPNSNILPVVNLSTFDVRDERTLDGNKTTIETGIYVGGLSPEGIKIGDEFKGMKPLHIIKQDLDRRAKAAKEKKKDLAI